MPLLIGTAPNQVPTNGDLGTMAFEDAINYNEKTLPNVIEVNSSSTALRVTQTGSGNALLVEDSANPDSTPFVIDASGNVLSGATNFTALTAGGASRFQAQGLLGYSGIYSGSDTLPSICEYSKNRGGTIVNSGDQIGQIRFSAFDGANYIRAAALTAEVDGTPGTNDMPGRLVFSTTADGASTPTERMRIDSAGRVGIGGTPAAGINLFLNKNITGATNAYGFLQNTIIQSDVTGIAYFNATGAFTAASSFTLQQLRHYSSAQGTIGAGSSVVNQYGFIVEGLTGATNNYGFYSNIASGTGRYNFYAAGSADNYFAGNVGIGTAVPGNRISIQGSSGSNVYQTFTNGTQTFLLGVSAGNVPLFGTTSNDPLLIYTSNTERMRIDSSGNVIQSAPTTAPTLSTNGTMVFNLTSNTNLRVSVRGSDGVTRTANITLA